MQFYNLEDVKFSNRESYSIVTLIMVVCGAWWFGKSTNLLPPKFPLRV